ncbi:hypothetical protein SDRG_00398 [Saprolegnia diclina VS20]|uniref:Proline-rich protein PRCC n=1 Tax=Saprolegnia diclina (strain VS20) TaxID=1156394 RepID=T0R6W2_SAPDV|nr:hypothetical protein SDRG_00398 [Saprolegnia diclina VS20]EQC42671.1 hypothetical protein SDRG_00398 [Saprolegnia diclina VS20]|eukprot:XP_008604094.1 hypothetical protein SDRG_00398 [Saprolegnia diclina VS20]
MAVAVPVVPPTVKPVAKPVAHAVAPAKPKAKKKRTVLFLPPEMQKLLESGRALNSDDSDDDDHHTGPAKKKAKAAPRSVAREAPDTTGLLGFLPAPKVALPSPPSPKVKKPLPPVQHDASSASAVGQAAAASHLYVPTLDDDGDDGDDAEHVQSKRVRNKERQLERMLQQGKFDAVAGQVVDVQAAAPGAWKPPIDGSTVFASDREAQVLAEMAGTETENGYVVASYRPSRLQRQRHQLNQLTFDAKLREFDLQDKKGLALKSKRETQAKYGW